MLENKAGITVICLVMVAISLAEIPPSVFRQLGEFQGTNQQFVENFVRMGTANNNVTVPGSDVDEGLFDSDGIPTRTGREHFGGSVAEAGSCQPKLQDCTIAGDSNPNMITWPMCTPVMRCGGCCGSSLECVPTQTRTVQKKVIKAQYNADHGVFDSPQTVEVNVEEHLACHCACRVRSEDCSANQEYISEDCKCRCRNVENAASCNTRQYWDTTRCRCACKKVKICEYGSVFNEDTCRCLLTLQQRERVTDNTGQTQQRVADDEGNRARGCPNQCPPGYQQMTSCRCRYVIPGFSVPRRRSG